MKTHLLFAIVVIAVAPAAYSQDPKPPSQGEKVAGASTNESSTDDQTQGTNQSNAVQKPDEKLKLFNEQFKAIMRKQVGTRNGLLAQKRTNKDDPEKLKEIDRAIEDNELAAAQSALSLIQTTDDEVSKIRVLVWGVRGLQGDAAKIMNKHLMDNFADSEEILQLRRIVLSRATPSHEAMIRQLISQSKNPKVRAMMTYTLAVYLKSLKEMPQSSRQMAINSLGDEGPYITNRSELQLSNEIEQLLDSCINDFPDVEVTERKISELATGMKFAATALTVGKEVPEIEGHDLDGKPFKISDYRGKVVVLDFWGDWCAACKMRYPHQRSLVQQLADKPFALIGVNSDGDLEAIRKIVKDKKLEWRSFWNGEKSYRGPISTKWDVRGWPMTYVIDANGIIRFRNLFGDDLDRAIEELLAEMGDEVKITHEFKKREEEARKQRAEQLKAQREKSEAGKADPRETRSESPAQENPSRADGKKGK